MPTTMVWFPMVPMHPTLRPESAGTQKQRPLTEPP